MFAQTTDAPKTPLCQLFHAYGSDKCPQIFHSYSEHYHALLSDRRTAVRSVIEIGIGSSELMRPIVGERYVVGASLRAWRDYFPNGSHLISDMITSYGALYGHLTAGGLYIIEDIRKKDLGVFESMPLHGGRILRAHPGNAEWDAFLAIEKA